MSKLASVPRETGKLVSFSQLPSLKLYEAVVDRYYIEYWSVDARGTLELISGCVTIPTEAVTHCNKSNLLVYNHGTATKYDFIPSQLNDPYAHAYGSFFSGLHKYITIMTDYIGYGASKHLPHAYCMSKTLGLNAVHCLEASIELFSQLMIINKIDCKNIFIGGYSEGGLASAAVVKLLETDYKKKFNVATCCAGAAPFTTNAKFSDTCFKLFNSIKT